MRDATLPRLLSMAARTSRLLPRTPGSGRRARRSGRTRAPGASGASVLIVVGLLVLAVLTVATQSEASPGWPQARPWVGAVVVTPTAQQASFIQRVGGAARRLRADVGLPPSLITAMAINETGWGSSELTRRANNYFGIKAEIGDGTVGQVTEETREVFDGRVVTVRAPFRAYRSLDESIQDLGAFLRANSRYDVIWASAHDPHASALALARAGYATDPDWPSKLMRLIDGFRLERLDAPF